MIKHGGQAPSRVAILSDPHGDKVALVRVIADLENVKPADEVFFGGDLAQGGAQPSEVIDEIQKRRWRSGRGNADDLLIKVAACMSAEDAVAAPRAVHRSLPRRLGTHAQGSVPEMNAPFRFTARGAKA